MNRNRTVGVLAALVILIGGALAASSPAAVGATKPSEIPASVTRTTTTCSTCVAPITCLQEDSCVLDYRNGAWYARQANGSTWVRLTLVNGN